MTKALILIAAGFLLIFIEFFVPGAIMGIAGTLILVVGLILFAFSSPSIALTTLVVVVSGALLYLMIRYTLYRIRTTKSDSSIYLKTDQEGYRASSFDVDLKGKEGIAISDMRPSGHVKIDGQQYQAVSRMGYLTKGTTIIVVGGEGGHLIVRGQIGEH